MSYEEALAWLRGERSTTNYTPQHPIETWQERIARADAALTEQAFWICKAHEEFPHQLLQPPAPAAPEVQG